MARLLRDNDYLRVIQAEAGRDAANELSVSFQLISKVLKGERNHTKGYKFIYA